MTSGLPVMKPAGKQKRRALQKETRRGGGKRKGVILGREARLTLRKTIQEKKEDVKHKFLCFSDLAKTPNGLKLVIVPRAMLV